MSVQVNSVTKIFGNQKALDQVSFQAAPGEIIGFLGPNGAGKSTMMKILTCYIPQTSGQAAVCGMDVNEQSLEVRKVIGYLPEHNPLYTDMYVKEYLEFIGGLHQLNGVLSKRVREMIEVTGLGSEQKKKIGSLSKGYRQRVGIAQAIIHDPKVLILDEPTSGLDPNQLADIRSLIRELGKEKTVIFSTHIMQEVEALCKRVIIINKGKVIADESTASLQKRNRGEEFVSVEFSEIVDKSVLLTIQGVNSAEQTGNKSWKLAAASGSDLSGNIFRFAVSKGLTVVALQKEEQKLEDVFRQLTQKR